MIIKPNEQIGKQSLGSLISLTKDLRKNLLEREAEKKKKEKEQYKKATEEVLRGVFG